MKQPQIALAAAVLLVLAANGVQGVGFVTEATSVVDQVIDQGQAANSEINDFYQDFSDTASRMVDLEARVERWKEEGYLCESYIDCSAKYDLIYAYYGQSMAEIQQAFQQHQDGILAALSRFNRIVYQGKDRLSDLRSDELAALPAEIERMKATQERLRTLSAELQQDCSDRSTRECKRRWRAFQRDLNRNHRDITRAAYTKKLATLRESILTRLEGVLEQYSDIEEEAVETLTHYAFLFEGYGTFHGSGGIGYLVKATAQLGDLDAKLNQMKGFAKGLEIQVLDLGSLMDDRANLGDINVHSRRERLTESGDLLDASDSLLQELQEQVGATPATSG